MSRIRSFVLSLTCLDEPGILASVSGGLARLECNVTESAHSPTLDRALFHAHVFHRASQS